MANKTFEVVVDARELDPVAFTAKTLEGQLTAGSYSVTGLEDKVAIRHYSLQNFVDSLENGAIESELQVAPPWFMVVFDGSWESLAKRFYTGALSPGKVIGMALSLAYMHGKPIVPGDGIDIERTLKTAWIDNSAKYPSIDKPPIIGMNAVDPACLIWTLEGLERIIQVRHLSGTMMSAYHCTPNETAARLKKDFAGVSFPGLVYEQSFGCDNARFEKELIQVCSRAGISLCVSEDGQRVSGRKRCLLGLWFKLLKSLSWLN